MKMPPLVGAHDFAHKRGRVPKDPNDAEYGAAREQADDDDRTQSDAKLTLINRPKYTKLQSPPGVADFSKV